LEEKSQLRYDSTKWQLSLWELIEGCVAVLHEPLCYYGYEMENTPVKTILEELGRRNDYIFAIGDCADFTSTQGGEGMFKDLEAFFICRYLVPSQSSNKRRWPKRTNFSPSSRVIIFFIPVRKSFPCTRNAISLSVNEYLTNFSALEVKFKLESSLNFPSLQMGCSPRREKRPRYFVFPTPQVGEHPYCVCAVMLQR